MGDNKITRRRFLKGLALAAGGGALAACQPQVVKETVVVEKVVEKPVEKVVQEVVKETVIVQGTPQVVEKVVEKVVTATPAPMEPVTVLWWRAQGGATGDLLDKFAADFTALDNGITVQPEYQGNYWEVQSKVIVAAAANALPDMILEGDGEYTPLALNGILLPMDEFIEGPNGIDLSTYKAPVYRGVQNGRMYQLCYGVSTPIYYYNKEALEAAGLEARAPDTWDEFFTLYAPTLTTSDMIGFAYDPGHWWQQSAYWAYGAMVNDVETFEIDFANPGAIEFFGNIQKAAQAGQVHIPTSAEGGIASFFGTGLAGMAIMSTGTIGSIDRISEGKFTTECGFLPGGPGGRLVPSGGNGLCIIRGTEVPEAAWAFVKYMHSPEQYAEYDKLTGYIPVQADVEKALADVIAADPRRQVAIDQFEFSRWHMRAMYSSGRITTAMDDTWNACVNTDTPVEELLQQLQEDACRIAKEEGFTPTCIGIE